MTAAATRDASMRVTIARSGEELESLRDAWQELQGDCIATDLDFFRTVVETEPHMLRPHVLLLEEEGGGRALVVGRIEDIRLPCKLGYRTLYAPRVRALTVVYEGVLGDPDEDLLRRTVAELRRSVDEGEADVLVFKLLRDDSVLHGLVAETPSFLCRQHVPDQRGSASMIELPATFDEFLGSLSSRSRANVRSYGNRLRRDYEGRHELRVFDRPNEIDDLFQALESVSSTTYQWQLGSGFRDEPANRARVALALERGWFKAWVLYLDAVPAAFWYGTGYHGRFRTGVPGFDPAHRKFRIGTFVLMRAIEDLCGDGVTRVLDLGFGDAEYKQHFATQTWQEESILVYGRRFRPARVNLTRTVVVGASLGIRSVVARLGLTQRIKTAWRARLSRGEAGS